MPPRQKPEPEKGAPRCFAYSKQLQRCEKIAGHVGPHGFSVEWGDDECYDPATVIETLDAMTVAGSGGTALVGLPAAEAGFPPEAEPAPVPDLEDDGMSPPCFVCGCQEDEHDTDGCVLHDCKAYLR